MRRRYVLALVLASALIFSTVGYYARTLRDEDGPANAPAGPVVSTRTATQAGNGHLNFCLSYYDDNPPARLPSNLVSVQGNIYELCWLNYGAAPECWASAKIGDVPPDVCR